MVRLVPHDIAWFTSPAELRAWLAEHHATAAYAWIGMRPKASGLPSVTWEQVVDEVLCVGWIDGVRMPAEHGSAIRITPRRKGSVWSARNVGRVEALRAEGRMQPAGEAAFAVRREDRTAIYLYEREDALDRLAGHGRRQEPPAAVALPEQPLQNIRRRESRAGSRFVRHRAGQFIAPFQWTFRPQPGPAPWLPQGGPMLT